MLYKLINQTTQRVTRVAIKKTNAKNKIDHSHSFFQPSCNEKHWFSTALCNGCCQMSIVDLWKRMSLRGLSVFLYFLLPPLYKVRCVSSSRRDDSRASRYSLSPPLGYERRDTFNLAFSVSRGKSDHLTHDEWGKMEYDCNCTQFQVASQGKAWISTISFSLFSLFHSSVAHVFSLRRYMLEGRSQKRSRYRVEVIDFPPSDRISW